MNGYYRVSSTGGGQRFPVVLAPEHPDDLGEPVEQRRGRPHAGEDTWVLESEGGGELREHLARSRRLC